MSTKRTITKYSIVGIVGLAFAFAAMAANPYLKPNNTWISISGSVEGVPTGDTFILNYDQGTITVEMDDWDNDADAYKLVEGDNVVVYGWIDDDIFETRTIEASSVYVENLGTYFYASGADEEDYIYPTVTVPVVVNTIGLQGTVSEVNGREFTLNTGLRKITVDTMDMLYNPMDDTGFQKIRKGDVVSVNGTIETDFFNDRQLSADSIVTLLDKNTNKN
jgi:uncharacterized protein YdeI (BOF family)